MHAVAPHRRGFPILAREGMLAVTIRYDGTCSMARRRWFYMSATTFEEARTACEELQTSHGIGQELRIIWNNEHTACLVCLDGASKDWRRPHRWIDDCVEVHCRTTYPGLSQIAVSGGWQQPMTDPEASVEGDETFWDEENWR